MKECGALPKASLCVILEFVFEGDPMVMMRRQQLSLLPELLLVRSIDALGG
jgi:hypothetical protein